MNFIVAEACQRPFQNLGDAATDLLEGLRYGTACPCDCNAAMHSFDDLSVSCLHALRLCERGYAITQSDNMNTFRQCLCSCCGVGGETREKVSTRCLVVTDAYFETLIDVQVVSAATDRTCSRPNQTMLFRQCNRI